MTKKPSIEKILFIILYSLILIFLIVILSLKKYYSALIIVIGTLFNIFIPISFLIFKENDLRSIKKTMVTSFIRLFTICIASIIPCLLYYFVPFIKDSVNILFLFYSPILTLIEYIIIRVFFIVQLKKEQENDTTNKEV